MWQKPINLIISAGWFNNVRKSPVLFWHLGIAFNLWGAFCQAFEGHIHATEPQIQLFFLFSKGLNFPWPHQKSKRFHAHYAERDVLKKKISVEKCSLFSCGLLFLFIALGKHLVCTGATKMEVSWVGKDVFLMLYYFLPLFCVLLFTF